MIKIKSNLSQNEMDFMRIWSEVIKKPYSIASYKLDEAANHIGYKRSGNCSTCMSRDAIELNNLYRRLLEKYNLQIEIEKSIEELNIVEEKEEEIITKKKNKK